MTPRDRRRRGRVAAACASSVLVALMLLPLVARAEVELSARLEPRGRIGLGESVTLVVTVSGATSASTPEFDLPEELDVLGSQRSQNVSWINGRMQSAIVHRFEIGASQTGTFEIGPIVVRVGRQAYRSGTLALTVEDGAPVLSGGGRGAAVLTVVLEPRAPVVGQPVIMTVRLVQRVAFAQDPEYTPPATTGFWTEAASAPESYYADVDGERVLVTETRTRLYPVSAGRATISEAVVAVVLAADPSGRDPLAWLGGLPRRQVVLRSEPVEIDVRALPRQAPAGFTGGVGDLEPTWSADRSRTARDAPVTLRLDVRGVGNLPLMRAPELLDPELERFASTVDDSLGEPGGRGIGRKRFQWTVLPKREGRIAIEAPVLAWFDPGAGTYRHASLPPVTLEVGPAVFGGAVDAAAFPTVLSGRPIDPARRAVPAWAGGVIGLLLAGAIVLWRSAPRVVPTEEDGRRGVWVRQIEHGEGSAFWRAADEASAWLAGRGVAMGAVREAVASARFGGAMIDPAPTRRTLAVALERAAPRAPGQGLRRAASFGLVILAVATACAVLLAPGGNASAAGRCLAADRAARAGETDAARREWYARWTQGARHPGLAARIAWSELQLGSIGRAALWTARGELQGGRDPGLAWMRDRVREAGGLTGVSRMRLPVEGWEWSVATLVIAIAAGWMWPRRRVALGLGALALVVALVDPIAAWRASRSGAAVVLEPVQLDRDLELDPGHVVRVVGTDRERVEVQAGQAARGWVPRTAIAAIAESRSTR